MTTGAIFNDPSPAEQGVLQPDNVFSWIFRIAQERLGAVAVVCNGEAVTFGEIAERVRRLSARLRAAGVASGDLVGVSLARSTDTLVALLAIFGIRGVYLPLDATLPGGRTSAVLDDARPKCIISGDDSFQPLVPVVNMNDRGHALCCPPESGLFEPPCPDDLAYVMYTSGSTGVPKGVMVRHRALTTSLHAILGTLDCEAINTHLAITRTTFDISLLELLMPLCCGGTVVIATAIQVERPMVLRSIAQKYGVVSLQATPTYLRFALQEEPHLVEGLTVLVGGEALPRDVARQLAGSAKAVWNLYGPTEATIWASAHRLTEEDVNENAPMVVTIGKSLPGYEIFVLAADGRPVNPSQAGEVHIAGPAVAAGYLNHPDLTARNFVSIAGLNDMLYRTGDLATVRTDGNLDFKGRNDRQVKINGNRLELGAVEAALKEVAQVADAAVATSNMAEGTVELIAAVILRPGFSADGRGIRRTLFDLVPSHMVPAKIVCMGSFPQTPHGKIDYQAIAQLGAPSGVSSEAGTGERCGRVCSIVAETLGLATVKLTDNFFDLGGDSLSGMRVVNRVAGEWGVELTLHDLFDADNVVEIAVQIEAVLGRRVRVNTGL